MSCKCKPIYAKRYHSAQGSYYTKHVCHMTKEGLHDKSEIAAELAHRDIKITRLTEKLEEAQATLKAIGELTRYEWSEVVRDYLPLNSGRCVSYEKLQALLNQSNDDGE